MITDVDNSFNNQLQLTVTLTLQAAPGAEIELLLDGSFKTSTTADESGVATVAFRPTLREIVRNVTVGLRYVVGDQAGPLDNTSLRRLIF